MSTFQLVDPVVERTAEGEEVIKGPCFCVADYFVSFTAKDSSKKMLYLKHSLSTVLPPEPLGADYVTDMDLTKRSSKRLKQLIERLEKKPNQSPEPTPTAVTTPADAGLAPAAVVAHV
jgi:adenine/guanine phosphoribosyltransferase-like PRPP-binding protein